MKFLKWLFGFLVLCALAALALDIYVHSIEWFQHWLAVHTGTVNESGPYYGFWSGFGSDLAEYVIITTLVGTLVHQYKVHECHDPKCHWIGRHPTEGGMFKLCRRHHPDFAHRGGKKFTLDEIHVLHHAERWRKHGIVPPEAHQEAVAGMTDYDPCAEPAAPPQQPVTIVAPAGASIEDMRQMIDDSHADLLTQLQNRPPETRVVDAPPQARSAKKAPKSTKSPRDSKGRFQAKPKGRKRSTQS